jgi:copper chaperone CopZ
MKYASLVPQPKLDERCVAGQRLMSSSMFNDAWSLNHVFFETLARLAVLAVLAGHLAAPFAATSVKATVNGMVCAFCAQGIEKKLAKLPAAQSVYVDLKQKAVAVEAKAGQTLDDKAIKAEITDAGDDVTKLETVEQSVAEVKAEGKASK